MSNRSTVRRQAPIYAPRNTGSAFGLQYAGIASLSAVVIMPMFLGLSASLTHVFASIGSAIAG